MGPLIVEWEAHGLPYLWVNYNELTVLPHWKSWFIYWESSPFMAELFRLVNYCNLPRYLGLLWFTGIRVFFFCPETESQNWVQERPRNQATWRIFTAQS